MPNISGQDDYGNQPTRHPGPCSSEAWKVFMFWFCLNINSILPLRLDRKIEIPLPNEQARMEVLKIHSNPITKVSSSL